MLKGVGDCYHACRCWVSRGELCLILERDDVFVLLPLLPSSCTDRRDGLGSNDLSYGVINED